MTLPQYQKGLIANLLRSGDAFCLIILDAMRYDTFCQVWSNGEIIPVYSAGSYTSEWLARTFDEKYGVAYFSGNPFCSHMPCPNGWRGTDHFSKVVPVWDFGWKKVKGCYTVPPEEVFKAYFASNEERAILHLMQPHPPFIGETSLPIPWLVDLEKKGVVKPGDQNRYRALYPYWVEKYGEDYVRKAYFDNAKYVVDKVRTFIDKLSCRVVITSDHGELLGENGRWGHLGLEVPELRIVPWVEL